VGKVRGEAWQETWSGCDSCIEKVYRISRNNSPERYRAITTPDTTDKNYL